MLQNGDEPMAAVASRSHRDGSDLALAGSALGVLAGIVQALLGSRIPSWAGANAPATRGLVTIAMSVLAGLAALTFERPATHPGVRVAATALVLVTGVAGFLTVQWLWLTPGPLMIAGAAFSATRNSSH